MRSIRHEFLEIACVMTVPIVIAAVMPFRAIGFSAARAPAGNQAAASCVFVELDDDAISKAIGRTRSSDFKHHADGIADNLRGSIMTLPPTVRRPMMSRPTLTGDAGIDPASWPSSMPDIYGTADVIPPMDRTVAKPPMFDRDSILNLKGQ